MNIRKPYDNYSHNPMKMEALSDKIGSELKLRNYRRKTIKSYLGCLADYFRFIMAVNNNPDIEKIKEYLLNKQMRGSQLKRLMYI